MVYSCDCVCFVLLCYLVNVFFYVSCVMFIDMFHIQMLLMQRLDQWNEYVYMYLCYGIFDILVLYGMWNINKFVF